MNLINILAHILLVFWMAFLPKALVSYLVDRKRTNFVLFWWACLFISAILFSISAFTASSFSASRFAFSSVSSLVRLSPLLLPPIITVSSFEKVEDIFGGNPLRYSYGFEPDNMWYQRVDPIRSGRIRPSAV